MDWAAASSAEGLEANLREERLDVGTIEQLDGELGVRIQHDMEEGVEFIAMAGQCEAGRALQPGLAVKRIAFEKMSIGHGGLVKAVQGLELLGVEQPGGGLGVGLGDVGLKLGQLGFVRHRRRGAVQRGVSRQAPVRRAG